MAQSIYVTLATLETETSVPSVTDKDGKVIRENFGSVKHTLPRENYPTPEIFDNEEMFLEWAQQNGSLLALLQSGVNDWLISDRATFKRMDKGKWSPEIGQKNVDGRKWKTSTKPDSAKTKQEKAKDAMQGFTKEEILAMLADMADKK
jgi:hypothetical protein